MCCQQTALYVHTCSIASRYHPVYPSLIPGQLPRGAPGTRLGPTTFYFYCSFYIPLSIPFIFFSTDFVNVEERNRKAHAENGNTSVTFSAAPVQPPAPCVPQTRRLFLIAASSFAPGPFLLHVSFFPRLKEVVVDRAFFEQLCREPAAAPEAPDRGFALRRISSKLLTAIMRPDFMLLSSMHARTKLMN